MSTKSEVLKLLEENKGTYLSGEELAIKLGCSRTAIWKAMKTLREEGYEILAVNNRGYALSKENNVLSEEAIRLGLNKKAVKIEVKREIPSTNQYLKQKGIEEEYEEGSVVVAESQSAGKGRRGRHFYSPGKCGLYMSVLLKPKKTAQESLKITAAAAVAVCRAVEKVCKVSLGIKWVNDLYLGEKKVCGILAEMALAADGSIEYAVVGIGININMSSEDFGAQLEATATSLYLATGIEYEHEQVLKAFLDEFDLLYSHWHCCGFALIRQDWLDYSCTLGHKVTVRDNDTEIYSGVAEDMDDYGSLLVRNAAGKIESFDFGEISIRSC